MHTQNFAHVNCIVYYQHVSTVSNTVTLKLVNVPKLCHRAPSLHHKTLKFSEITLFDTVNQVVGLCVYPVSLITPNLVTDWLKLQNMWQFLL